MDSLYKIFLFIGGVFITIGLVIFIFNKIHIPLGRLPGDIAIEKENFRFYFPITTMIIISIVLSLILNIIKRIF